jgi:hypothetical protein
VTHGSGNWVFDEIVKFVGFHFDCGPNQRSHGRRLIERENRALRHERRRDSGEGD